MTMSLVSDWIRLWSMFRVATPVPFFFVCSLFWLPGLSGVREGATPGVSGRLMMLSRLSMMVARTGGSPELSVMEFSLSYEAEDAPTLPLVCPPASDEVIMPASGVEARCFVFLRIMSVIPSSSTCNPSRYTSCFSFTMSCSRLLFSRCRCHSVS
uniref:Putative secreted protein n=1 Tax=Anopheles darlingi TaxID=43151 RepID=A0A2M4DFN3_ANODA